MFPGQLQLYKKGWTAKSRSLSIICAGHGVCYRRDLMNIFGQLYIQDIKFEHNGQRYCIGTGKQAKLWLNKCKFTFTDPKKRPHYDDNPYGKCGIATTNKSYLNINECEFDGAESAIKIDMKSHQTIITRNVFKNCGGCIEIVDTLPTIQSHFDVNALLRRLNGIIDEEEHGFVKLECDSNVFENNVYYPIAERVVEEEQSSYIQNKDL